MFIIFDVKVKLHMYCNFEHNLFNTCVSASTMFFVTFDTLIRFLISGANLGGWGGWGGGGGGRWGMVFTLFLVPSITWWTPNCWYHQALSYISEFIWCDPWNIWGVIWQGYNMGNNIPKSVMTQVLGFSWTRMDIRPVDFSYKWRGFHRTPYGLAEPGDSGLWYTQSRGTIYPKTAMTQVLDFVVRLDSILGFFISGG